MARKAKAARNLGFARVDLDRERRRGRPEVIFCEGKTPEQVARIAEVLWTEGGTLLATRATEAHYEAVRKLVPGSQYHAMARCITAGEAAKRPRGGLVGVVCAGTTDLPVAEEALATLRSYGRACRLFADVGVAGLDRLLEVLPALRKCKVLIVVAGMEGALPSVVAGQVSCPVIAVPTSVGYGAAFGGLAALLGMLTSCANGVTVVNIDNGFGAASAADAILRLLD